MRDQRHAPAALNPRERPVPIVQEAGWAPGPVWTGAENLVPTGIRSPDRPARSQLLYGLRYPANSTYCDQNNFEFTAFQRYVFILESPCINFLILPRIFGDNSYKNQREEWK